jgi:galactitol-specific phosphotransferase system IIB component
LTKESLSDLFLCITQGLRHLRLFIALISLVLAVSLSACGGGGGSSASTAEPVNEATTKAEASKPATAEDAANSSQTHGGQANAICETAKREQSAGFVALAKQREQNPSTGQSEEAGLEEVVRKVALPPIEKAARKLSKLDGSAKERREAEELAKSLKKATAAAEADPLSVSANSKHDPFDDATRVATSSGLEACASLG